MKHLDTYAHVLFTLMAVSLLNALTVLAPLITLMVTTIMGLSLFPIAVVIVKLRERRQRNQRK